MSISLSQFLRAVMKELRVDLNAEISQRANWRIVWQLLNRFRISLGGPPSADLFCQIQVANDGGLFADFDQQTNHRVRHRLSHLGRSCAFSEASKRLVDHLHLRALPFLDDSLSDLELIRLVLWKASHIVTTWPHSDDDQCQWLESLMADARKSLDATKCSCRRTRWMLLLSTIDGLLAGERVSPLDAMHAAAIDAAFANSVTTRRFINQYRTLLTESGRSDYEQSEFRNLERHSPWFTRTADLTLLLLADNLL